MIKFIKTFIPSSLKANTKIILKNYKAVNKNQKIIEHMEIDFMLSRLHSQKKIKILEIGSHRGEIFEVISGNNFSHKFYLTCIEPNPESFKILKQKHSLRLKRFVKVIFYNIGISSSDEVLTFFSPTTSSALFTLHKENLNKFNLQDETIKNVNIPTHKIETLLKKKFIDDYYDIIKIDAEGSDYEITLQIIKNNISYKNLMLELDQDNLEPLSKILSHLDHYSAHVFLRDGIKTLTIEKFTTTEELKILIKFFQEQIINQIAGNIVFVDKFKTS
jgi:FkbM family methyltransferase